MSYIDDIAEIAYNYVVKRLDEELEMSKSCSGGALRYFSGETVENLIHIIWNELAEADINKINSIKIKDLKGDKVPLTVCDSDGNSINESVDRHCFINGKLVAAIECKTYIDKCYMQRADSDFNIMKMSNNAFKAIIVSLEDSVKSDSFNFFMNRGNIDKVFILADGKRNSEDGKQIYKTPQRLNKSYFKDLVSYLDSLVR